jgi:hypothetical protein
MPITPALPIVPVLATGHHTPAHPQPAGAFAALAFGTGVRAQTAAGIKPAGTNAHVRTARRGTETDDSLDEETNTLDAKTKRSSGNHILDVEA